MPTVTIHYDFTTVRNRIQWSNGVITTADITGQTEIYTDSHWVVNGEFPEKYKKYRPTKCTVQFYGRALSEDTSIITVKNDGLNLSTPVNYLSAAARQEHSLSVPSNECLNPENMAHLYFGATEEFTLWADTYPSVELTIEYELIPYRTVKYYDGKGWVECIPHYYDGKAWVKCDPYYHDGKAWLPCSHIN